MSKRSIAQRMNTRLASALRTEADLKIIAKRLKSVDPAVKRGNYRAMSEANKEFHMSVAYAGNTQYLATFYKNCYRRASVCSICILNIWGGPTRLSSNQRARAHAEYHQGQECGSRR
ncbi:FCD domain-containing protein [Rhizobium mesoamericanum]|uniref:FCD domain-containing protein n=1 Tax=Rhizobium mesoamericanum TaxID=1079800 RepID=UPI00040D4716